MANPPTTRVTGDCNKEFEALRFDANAFTLFNLSREVESLRFLEELGRRPSRLQ